MKIVLSWLREYCDWEWPVAELVERLTMSGTEVENVEQTGFALDGFVTAKVDSYIQHPNADRLRLCQINDGTCIRQVVCGASNFEVGDSVALATPGAVMPAGFKIKKSKLRGEVSDGMLCSSEELGLPEQSDEDQGILILDQKQEPGVPLKELYSGETVLECEVTPNRSDLLSYRGFSREMEALGARKTDFVFTRPHTCVAAHSSWSVDVQDVTACPRYTAAVIEGVKVQPSPAWIQERLTAAGLRPVNNIVDITNYVLLETGQPLHAFDSDVLNGNQIIVRRAAENESILALDGETYELNETDLVIADTQNPVAIAGVMGGEISGVSEKSETILLESARFEPASVRATSRRLGLISDSSYRFERGIDPLAVDLASARALELILELAGGKLVGVPFESAPVVTSEITVPLRLNRVEKLLGFAMSQERVTMLLGALGCRHTDKDWQIPSYRLDLRREVDLIEELARFEGLETVEAALPAGTAPSSQADQRYNLESALRQRLTGWGYVEALTGSLVPVDEASSAVRLQNPLVVDAAQLRTTMLETLLPCVRKNLGHGNEDLKLFEIGTVFEQYQGRSVEKRRLVLVGTGKDSSQHWNRSDEDFGYFHLKGIFEGLGQEFSGIQLTRKKEVCGLVSSDLLKVAGIKVPVWFAEWDLTRLKQRAAAIYQPLADYPAIKRDLAFTMQRSVAAADVEHAILKTGINELQSVVCFDVFQDDLGQKLDASQKSLAYALTYRSSERTLKDKEVAKWDQRVIESVKKETGAALR
ncbi:MAG: phenylalanine--tRNA ligase subunit beta [Verrucomicrobiota bacterium]